MEKSTIKRKIGVCLMALAMIVAMIPSWSVTANAATDYGLVVDYAKVTSDRTSGDGWSYNPATNTLTLNGYTYSEKDWVEGSFSGGIYSSSDLKIELVGNNSINNTYSHPNCYNCGIYVKGTLTIKGNGSLTTQGGGEKGSYGIMAGGLTVNSGTITAIGKTANDSCGIVTNDERKDMTVNNGTITARAAIATGTSCGIRCSGNFTMNDGKVKAVSEGVNNEHGDSCGINSGKSIYCRGGVLAAEGQTKAMYSSQSTYPNGYTKGDKTFRTYGIATDEMYTVSGANENGWANSEVKLTAISGYKIGKTDKQFGSSISFTDEAGSGVFYIKKTSDGTIYKGTISYNLDKTAPKISGATNGGTYCVSKDIRVNDSHLAEVKDGNIVLGPSNGTYTLPAGTHNITATDLAGNSTSITVTVNEAHDPNKDDGNCATAVTCKVCGDVLTQAKSHRYAWASGPEGHWMECQNAGCTSKTTLQRHVPGAAATEDTAQTCTVCGYTINPPLGHVCQNHLQKVNATAATCTQDGNNEYYKCTCGKIYSDTSAQNEKSESDFTIQATGHSYGTPAYTWSEDNLTCTAVRTCEICRDQESETETAVTQVTPKDGCKSPETTLYTVTFAGSAFAAQTKAVVTKEADAHTPSEWIVDKKATTAEAGSRHQECTECGTVLKTETIAKLTDSKANINPSGKNDADKNAGEKSASSVPGTGDTSLVDVWALLMAFAVLGGVYALCRQRKAR